MKWEINIKVCGRVPWSLSKNCYFRSGGLLLIRPCRVLPSAELLDGGSFAQRVFWLVIKSTSSAYSISYTLSVAQHIKTRVRLRTDACNEILQMLNRLPVRTRVQTDSYNKFSSAFYLNAARYCDKKRDGDVYEAGQFHSEGWVYVRGLKMYIYLFMLEQLGAVGSNFLVTGLPCSSCLWAKIRC